MIDFVEYIVSELKQRRLSKADALGLIRQFSMRGNGAAPLHPLLHVNVSDLDQQAYLCRFGGDEFFLRDHRIQGRSVLPGVAYLEMARAALDLALPERAPDVGFELRNAVWSQPIAFPERTHACIGLFPDGDGPHDDRIALEVYSDADTVHFQAQASLCPHPASIRHDLSASLARMGRATLDGEVLYAAMARAGIELGPAHRGVLRIHRGDGEALAEIELPSAVADGADAFALHPSVLDSAVQAGMALASNGASEQAPLLPFALESLRMYGPTTSRMFAWVRYADGSGPSERVVRLDIDLCDADGAVRVRMAGFSARAVPSATGASLEREGVSAEEGCLLAVAEWDEASPAKPSADWAERHVLLIDLPHIALSEFTNEMNSVVAAHLGDVDSGGANAVSAARYREIASECLRRLQTTLADRTKGRVLWQLVMPNDDAHYAYAGLHGMLATAAQENPKFGGQLIAVDASANAAALASALKAEASAEPDGCVRFLHERREVLRWREVRRDAGPAANREDADPNAALPLRAGGAYLITGGLGALGQVFARDILARVPDSRVMLTGRSPVDARIEAIVSSFDAEGRVRYTQMDPADPDRVRDAVHDTLNAFGRLDGIVHSAGAIRDNFILKKTTDELREVFAPKVDGTLNLDAATREVPLDFFALFSSGVAAFGNAGQADYAAANGFMDGFARWRNAQAAAGARHGIAIAYDWPLWADGGMRPDDANRAAIAQATGMRAMSTENGLSAFYRGLTMRADRLMAVEGDLMRLRRTLLAVSPVADESAAALSRADAATPARAAAPVSAPEAESSAESDAERVGFERARDYLCGQLSEVLRLPAHKIDPMAPLERYGIDSILAMELTAQLELAFGSLPKTLFFEYQTVQELTEYFLRDHAATLARLLSPNGTQRPTPAAAAPKDRASTDLAPAERALSEPPTANAGARPGARRSRRLRAMSDAAAPALREPIAIVGLSGCYPESPDLEAFWRNLRDGKDCITEIPASRWDWRDYYSEDRTAEGAHFSKWGGFIAGVDEFDPLFFGIPPVDAEMIDPQERLFLQHAWMAVEDAGYTRAGLQAAHDARQAGQVGVYVGLMYGEYQLLGAESSLMGRRMAVPLSYASIANRISYLLNVHGPSMTLDTMCSSSLTAIHLACMDLRLGRTHAAIAGGVNVTIHPNKYLILSAGQFISTDGHCQSFGVGGDGYIPGEGVGAVVLKRLSDAERDGNHIYGLIRGSALNHGGKTNGYSVPNPKAQTAVIALALKEAGADPRSVSYIEAHGTGTKLGDPIEIAALAQAFRQSTQERGFCAIGSAKSNIGHCESAAGIAGLTKVLLQMKHGMLVPSLHSSTLNPHIDFDATPFVVNQTLRPWERPIIDGRRAPRIAGISSFGAGGSNAHLVVEEYVAPPATRVAGAELLPLSARTTEQLRSKARDLLAYLEREGDAADLHAIACTLQLGREIMDARLACVADSPMRLREALQAFLDDGRTSPDAYCVHGVVRKDEDGIAALARDDDMREAIGKWIARRKLTKLADVWVRGLELDWRALRAGAPPRFVSLPTYPFARDRYWLSLPGPREGAIGGAALHPLVHRNRSDLRAQRYVSEFRGGEFVFADHQVAIDGVERKVLPGAAYLEMIRAAVADAAADVAGPLTLRHIAWAQPLFGDAGARAEIVLSPADDGEIDVEVASGEGDAHTVHCVGRVALADDDESRDDEARLDPQALRARMRGGAWESDALYAAFAAMGLRYGPGFRCVRSLLRGEGEALAELVAPDNADPAYALHPGVLDSALQSAMGLLAADDALPQRPTVPFALDELRLSAPCAPRMYAWVREAESGAQVRKLDLDLCDAEGRIRVRLRGLASRAIGAQDDGHGVLMARPVWEDATVATAATPDERVVLLCGVDIDAAALGAAWPRTTVESLDLPTGDAAARYRAAVDAVFARVQAWFQRPLRRSLSLQLVVADTGENALMAGLAGMIDTARSENPLLLGQTLHAAGDVDATTLAAHLRTAAACASESRLRVSRDGLQVARWRSETLDTHVEVACAYRDAGVYVITGGLGGLGRVFARDILRRTPAATVVLSGRGEIDERGRDALAALCAETSVAAERLVYRRLDPNDGADTVRAIDAIVAEFGRLDGVLHSAGQTRDGLIAGKRADELALVLGPKVDGTAHLDAATARLDLDIFVLFSSLASAVGNPGQADYAAANGFMDRFAEYRNALTAAGERRGRALAVHWPLWAEGGMRMDADALAAMREASGMTPLRSEHGVAALHRALAMGESRVLVIEGELARLRRSLRPRAATVSATATAIAPAAVASTVSPPVAANEASDDRARLFDAAVRYLREEFAGLFRMPAHEVDPKAPLEQYGMDSVLAMKLTHQLERSFGSLSKTLFFEYQTIAALAGHLVDAFPVVLREKTGVGASARPGDAAAGASANAQTFAQSFAHAIAKPSAREQRARPSRTLRSRFAATPAGATASAKIVDEVAIVGLAGRYPQAPDVDAFWENLKAGRDCIVEIPAERWDHARYFHPERNRPGKTYSKWGGFLDGVDRFDALFFSISPKEAELMDPQERLFLETAWETIEDAGYSRDAIAGGRVGVYVGVMWGQYELYAAGALGQGVPSSSFASIANRVSYVFDFHGPSLALDTMCSSSLTAIHLAAEEVRKGTIDAALAGGVNVSVHPGKYLSLAQGNFASTDGRCRSFGEGGDGYVPGEGVGAVLLKRRSDALRDGDRIYAIVRGGAINHGGKTNGYTVPNPVAQSDVVLEALRVAGVEPSTLGYLETHGTGTSLGDPIEIAGLARALAAAGAPSPASATCAIGSVKSNIGHLESAAGIAAVTKALLQLRHRQWAPSLHARTLNPHIDFAATPFRVQTELADWPAPVGHPRRIGVSSFGAGGANAHLILEEFRSEESRSEDRPFEDRPFEEMGRRSQPAPQRPELFLLSARTRDALRESARRWLAFVDGRIAAAPNEDDASTVADIAYTSQVGRTPMQERLALIADDLQTLRARLAAWLAQNSDDRDRRSLPTDTFQGSLREAQAQTTALLEGEAGRALTQLSLERRDLAKLAQLWVVGAEIDWTPLHADAAPRRVALPTYPFARERYWIETGPAFFDATAERATASASVPTPSPAMAVSHWRPFWRECALEVASTNELAATPARVLLIGADAAMVAAFQRAVADEAAPTASVVAATLDAVDGDALDAQCDALLDGLAASEGLPDAVVAIDAAATSPAASIAAPARLHAFCRAWLRRRSNTALRLLCAHVARNDAVAHAAHAALAGYLKSFALEQPKTAWKTLRLAADTDAAASVRAILDELRERRWRNGEIALRDGIRRLREFAHVASPPATATGALRQRGVYLITGGLGGLGALIAAHLAERYDARLVLTGRSAADDATEQRLRLLCASGGEAAYVRADVADAAQAAAAVAEARTRFGRLDGVIHSAGIHRDAFALNKSHDDFAAVLAAKTAGTVNLDAAIGDSDLDLFVSFSSVAGAFGNLGQCDYAAANAFLDAFAEMRQTQVAAGGRKGRTLSIGWPFWAEGGMRIGDGDIAATERRTGMRPLPTEAGIACWEALLQDDAPHTVAMYGDTARISAWMTGVAMSQNASPHQRSATHIVTNDSMNDASNATASGAIASRTGERVADDAALPSAVEAYLKGLLSEQIKLPTERIDAEERFESFGVDSMMIARLNEALERDLGELPKTLFYEYASIDELAGYLLRETRPALRRFLASTPNESFAGSAAARIASGVDAQAATLDVVEAFAASNPVSASAPIREPAHPPIREIAASPVVVPAQTASERMPDRRVAIVGSHLRVPQADTPEAFWRLLREGRDLVGPVPSSRWNAEALYDADPTRASEGKIYCKWGAFLDDVDAFDAAFFNIGAEEARNLDPQERLFLESVWSAVEDAGYTRDGLHRRYAKRIDGRAAGADVGVFVGVTSNTYQLVGADAWVAGRPVTPSSMPWSIANRVSYVFDFQGPSLPIDTACSSSLVAIQMACDSLHRGECRLAVAGGVNLYLHPAKYHSLCSRRMLAQEGKCRSFGGGDDGFVPGEGVGAVLLKPLAEAIADGDHIHGVVAGGAIGHAGRSNGYSTPNPNAQAQLIDAALRAAQAHPDSIGYVEGHGTGTQLGDNLEVVALTQAFRARTRRDARCALGSVKSNLGHSESAAGMAGVAKVLLQFAHRAFAPTLHAEPQNPDIDFADTPFALQRAYAPWPATDGLPRRALIDGFGAGGVNACLVLEEAPSLAERAASTGPELIVLSARNAQRLKESAARLRDHLHAHPDLDLARVAYTLQVGRESMEERLAVVATSVASVVAELSTYLDDAPSSALMLGRVEAHRRRKANKPDVRERARALCAQGEWEALGLLWVGGQDVAWDDLRSAAPPRKLPLPTYPFARDRYWVESGKAMRTTAIDTERVFDRDAAETNATAASARPAALHPLIAQNVSTLRETAFLSMFDADAFYGRDHRVDGVVLFPGACYLEMACAAGAIAGERSVLRIEDAVWMQPLPLGAAQPVKTVLRSLPGEDGNVAEFFVASYDEDNAEVIHCEGRLRFGERPERTSGTQVAYRLDELLQLMPEHISGEECYRRLRAAGFDYGPTFRTLQALHVGDGAALAELRLDDSLHAEASRYLLHPCLIDGALQSVLGAATGDGGGGPYLPFAIGEIEILRPLPNRCRVYVERRLGDPGAQPDVVQFDLRILADNGEVLVRINRFYVRASRSASARTAQAQVSA